MYLNLPQLDGWEATRCLKANPNTQHIPVIAFTAYATDKTRDLALEAGCVDIITKPFEFDTLLMQVSLALGELQAQKELSQGEWLLLHLKSAREAIHLA